MGCNSTSRHLLNLMSQFDLDNKKVLELGFFPGATEIDFKKHITKGKNVLFYRSNLSNNEGIDFSWDLHKPLPIDAPVKNFDFIICSSVMEHVSRPWLAAKNIESVIGKKGILIWTTPWVWRIHGYPNDYWRFTPNAVKELFTNISWSWIGYEITNGLDQSVLIDTVGWEKDACIQFSPAAYQKLSEAPCFPGIMNIKSKSAIFVSSDKTYKVKNMENPDESIYKFITSGKLSPVMCPMSNFIMIGKKQ
ncbi:class I SAM-dependent methyltransferase [Betaproteobacteria bacterium]|nr:class I SAM-dependent methyltransferase [Betaproteobacteria bacterium]